MALNWRGSAWRQAWHAFKASRRQSVMLQQIIDEYEKEQSDNGADS